MCIFDFYQVIGKAATAVKDAIEPLISDASMAAAISHGDPGSVQNKKWMQTARKVRYWCNNHHAALPLPGRSQHTCAYVLNYTSMFLHFRIYKKMLNQQSCNVWRMTALFGFPFDSSSLLERSKSAGIQACISECTWRQDQAARKRTRRTEGRGSPEGAYTVCY